MKQFQQRLLILLAIGLCGLCARQWYVQSMQHVEIVRLENGVAEKNGALLNASNTLKTADHQVMRMDAEISGLSATIKTNVQLIAAQNRELKELQAAHDALSSRVDEYKKVVAALEIKLKDSYDGIKKQNEAVQQLVTQRDDFVARYNASIKERNEIVAKYNDLAKEIEKHQPAAASQKPVDPGGK
jgi:chromosome segregation ATPase